MMCVWWCAYDEVRMMSHRSATFIFQSKSWIFKNFRKSSKILDDGGNPFKIWWSMWWTAKSSGGAWEVMRSVTGGAVGDPESINTPIGEGCSQTLSLPVYTAIGDPKTDISAQLQFKDKVWAHSLKIFLYLFWTGNNSSYTNLSCNVQTCKLKQHAQ